MSTVTWKNEADTLTLVSQWESTPPRRACRLDFLSWGLLTESHQSMKHEVGKES